MSERAIYAFTEQESLMRWGCSYADYLSLQCKPMRAFQNQRSNARRRDIGWELNLWQWWTIWQASGRWEHRGRGQGYVMCRKGDVGPYAAGNVFIAPAIVNHSDRLVRRSNLPIGVRPQGKRFVAKRYLNGKNRYLGAYDTPELAHAAYLALGPIGIAGSAA